jgi:hypothetical protein
MGMLKVFELTARGTRDCTGIQGHKFIRRCSQIWPWKKKPCAVVIADRNSFSQSENKSSTHPTVYRMTPAAAPPVE